jgi:DNA-binding MurR/RpiR family transcriptional regulator
MLNDTTRYIMVRMLLRGEATMAQLARWAGVSEAAIYNLCRAYCIDYHAAQEARFNAAIKREVMRANGRTPRKPSKAEIRRKTEAAVRQWRRRHDEA